MRNRFRGLPEILAMSLCLPQRRGMLQLGCTSPEVGWVGWAGCPVLLFIDVVSLKMCLLLGKRELFLYFEGEQEKPESLQSWYQNLSPRYGLQFLQWALLCLLVTLIISVFIPSFWVQSMDMSILIWSPDVGEQVCHPEMAQRVLELLLCDKLPWTILCIYTDFHRKWEVIQLCGLHVVMVELCLCACNPVKYICICSVVIVCGPAQNNLGMSSLVSSDRRGVRQGWDSLPGSVLSALWQWDGNFLLITKGLEGRIN